MHHFLPELKLWLIARDFKDDFSILRVRVRGGKKMPVHLSIAHNIHLQQQQQQQHFNLHSFLLLTQHVVEGPQDHFTRRNPLLEERILARNLKIYSKMQQIPLILFLLAIAGAALVPNQVYAHDQGAVETANDIAKVEFDVQSRLHARFRYHRWLFTQLGLCV